MMSTPITSTHMPEHMGRLPEAVISWPISRQRFCLLAEFWLKQGVTLLLCNDRSELVVPRDSLPSFWQHILKSGQTELLNIACRTGDDIHHASWRGAFLQFRIPVMQKHRRIGVLIGLVVKDVHGEDFAKCCDSWKLDRSAMLSMAATIPLAGTIAPQFILDMLHHNVRQAIEFDLQDHSIASLTQNLENTYEELGLVYRISREMSIPENPKHSLASIGGEILQVSRAEALVFLLIQQDKELDEDRAAGLQRVVHCGREHTTLSQYLRLGNMFDQTTSSSDHFLHNNVCRRSEFSWAASWLQHLVALPIRQGDRLLAVMMAVNCRDGGDFTSIDVQLLRTVADRIASFLETQRLYHDLAELFMGLLHSLINSVDAKDPYTCGHSERVAHFSRLLARSAGLGASECERVYLAGLLHDVGKIGIPDAILSKPGKLTEDEFNVLKQHPQIGAYIVDHVRQIHDLIPAVLHHHERMDGRGYPHGLAGEDIPLLGRIVCLADCFDAMTTNRTYRAAMPVQSAIAEIRRCSGTQFDPRLAELFLELDLPVIFADARQKAGQDRATATSGALQMAMSTAMLASIETLPKRVTNQRLPGAACPQV